MKIHIPQPIYKDSEMNILIMPGLTRRGDVELVSEGQSADFILYHYSGEGDDFAKFNPEWNGKCVILDYQDDPFKLVKGEWSYYFKRSVADKTGNRPKRIEYRTEFPVLPLPYCVKEYEGRTGFDYPRLKKEYDVCCLFELENSEMKNRNRVVNFIEGLKREGINAFTGLIDWFFLRRSFSDGYFEMMLKSKIVVTCNPDNWEGDYRLFEALTTDSLVFCDNMLNKMGLDNNIVWYDPNDMLSLKEKIVHFLENPLELKMKSETAFSNTKMNHTSDARVKFIIETILKK